VLTRIVSALVALPAVLYLIHLGGWAFAGLAALASGICLVEFAGMTLGADRVAGLAVLLLGLLTHLGAITGALASPAGLALAAVLFVALLLVFLFRPGDLNTVAARLGLGVAGVFWPGALLGTIACLRLLPDGETWVLLACILAWGADTGGYFAGRFLGKHKLYEKVSPKKTWEGAVGGVLTATGMAFILRALLGGPSIDPIRLLVLCPVVTVLGQLGDLAESLLKRSVGVKDSGKIMPGHGGLFDRVDALIFTSPALFAYAILVEHLAPAWLRFPS
jgi:phosphatidate cytidylyltransferase